MKKEKKYFLLKIFFSNKFEIDKWNWLISDWSNTNELSMDDYSIYIEISKKCKIKFYRLSFFFFMKIEIEYLLSKN